MANNSKSRQNFSQVALDWSLKEEKLYLLVEGVGAGVIKKLPYDPAIPLLGIHTKETRSERDTCTPMFIAALFVIART